MAEINFKTPEIWLFIVVINFLFFFFYHSIQII